VTKEEISQIKTIDNTNQENLDDEEVMGINVSEKSLTHFEASDYINALENYFIVNCPESLNQIYNLKNIISSNKLKRQTDIFDYLKMSNN
jgi:hypothetical protein